MSLPALQEIILGNPSGEFQVAATQLSAAQIQTLRAIPVTLISGRSGSVILPISVAIAFNHVSVDYTANGNIEIDWNATTIITDGPSTDLVDSGADAFEALYSAGGVLATSLVDGEPVTIRNAGSAEWANSSGPVTEIAVTAGNGGQGYVTGTDTGTISGGGGNATFSVSSVSAGPGPIATLSGVPTSGHAGLLYAADDTGTISGGDGTATYKVLTVNALTGAVETLELTAGGTDYGVGADNGTTPTSGSGDGSLKVDILTVTGGAVTGLILTAGGTGYSTGTGNATSSTAGAGTGLEIDVDAVDLGDGTMTVTTTYQIVNLS